VELRQLRYFVTLAEELHFRRAAAREHIVHSALSEQVQRLERELQVQLFTRTTRKVRLTEAGVAVLEQARAALRAVDQIAEVAGRAARAEAGELHVGYMQSSSLALPRVLRVFAQRHPAVAVGVRQYNFDDSSAGLRSGASDVAFVRPPIDDSGLVLETVTEEPRVAVLPADHPLAEAPALSVRQLLDEPWAVMPPYDPLWRDFWLCVEHRDGVPPRLGPEVHSFDEYVTFVLSGQAVGLAGRTSRGYIGEAGLALVSVPDVAPCSLALGWPEGGDSPLVRAFAATVREVLGAPAPTGRRN